MQLLDKSRLGNASTASERLFASYLTGHGYSDWSHEDPIPGKPTTPDFCLQFDGRKHFFEVKEFAPLTLVGGEGGPFDPYGPIREKVNQAGRQFKNYKEFSCSLVVADPNGGFVNIDSPEIVIGTMLGNIGFTVSLDNPDAPATQIFGGGGKMVNKRKQPQNTTINAIVCLTPYNVRQKRLEITLDQRDKQLGRTATPEETWEFLQSVKSHETEALRVIVFENPFARIPLDRRLFKGSWDERWGSDGKRIRRLYAGRSLRRMEKELAKCDRRSPIQKLIDKSQEERRRLMSEGQQSDFG